jgi:hypothetical protein
MNARKQSYRDEKDESEFVKFFCHDQEVVVTNLITFCNNTTVEMLNCFSSKFISCVSNFTF